MDVGILIDSSSAISPTEFGRIRSFVITLIKKFTSRYVDVYFGIIVYNENPNLVLTLQNTHLLNVSNIIHSVKYKSGGHRTDLAIVEAAEKLFCADMCNHRRDSMNIMIVFTAKDTDAGSLPYEEVQTKIEVS